MIVNMLERGTRPALAYRLEQGDTARPAVLLLSGYAADMTGTKSRFLSEYCRDRGLTFAGFDYSGHGVSGGSFEDCTIGSWKDDALDIIDRVVEGGFVIVGSSMGGWIGLLASVERAKRVRGLIGVAAAPDFTRHILSRLGPAERDSLARKGRFYLAREGGMMPTPVTQRLLEDGERHCLLDGPIAIDCPVRLIQGVQDDQVPWMTAERIMARLTTEDKKLYLQESGDHRLVRDEDLALLGRLVDELTTTTGN